MGGQGEAGAVVWARFKANVPEGTRESVTGPSLNGLSSQTAQAVRAPGCNNTKNASGTAGLALLLPGLSPAVQDEFLQDWEDGKGWEVPWWHRFQSTACVTNP